MLTLPPMIDRRQFQTAAVYAFLTHFCLALCEDTSRSIERQWVLSAAEIDRLAIRSAPSRIENLIGAAACTQKFGGDIIAGTPGFKACQNTLDKSISWEIDLDERLCRRGLLLPLRNNRFWITGFLVYRHVRDERPFRLTTRKEDIAA